jgi:hypothetical protein
MANSFAAQVFESDAFAAVRLALRGWASSAQRAAGPIERDLFQAVS